jgi:hypothetical protein
MGWQPTQAEAAVKFEVLAFRFFVPFVPFVVSSSDPDAI